MMYPHKSDFHVEREMPWTTKDIVAMCAEPTLTTGARPSTVRWLSALGPGRAGMLTSAAKMALVLTAARSGRHQRSVLDYLLLHLRSSVLRVVLLEVPSMTDPTAMIALARQQLAKSGKVEACEAPMGIDTPPKPRLPAWQDVLGDAEQLVRQKPAFSKYIKGTVLENDVPVWIADFAQRLLLRELARIRAVIASDRCDGDTEYAAGANAARAKYLAALDKR